MGNEKVEWKMPEWMEPYRGSICNTGGNPIEELMNDHRTSGFSNLVRASLIVSVRSQITLLHSLHKKGILEALTGGEESDENLQTS